MKERNNTNVNHRSQHATRQPKAAIEKEDGYGDKKLDGPNRPST